MVTWMDSMVARQRRGEVAREVESGRLDRKWRTARPQGRESRWMSWFRRRIGPPDTPAAPKIRHLGDAGIPARP